MNLRKHKRLLSPEVVNKSVFIFTALLVYLDRKSPVDLDIFPIGFFSSVDPELGK